MNIFEKALASSVFLALLFNFASFQTKCETISEKVLRIHILANSNSKEDQELKLKVRDKILEHSKYKFSSAQNKDEAVLLSQDSLQEIKQIAENEIQTLGYSYPVEIEFVKMYFTTRRYEDITLPAGNYDAVRIIIGQGKGKNWWCVMFPAICLGSSDDPNKLDAVFNEDEKNIINSEKKYEFKFKCVEIYEKYKSLVSELF